MPAARSLQRPFGALMRFAWDHSPEIQNIEGIVPVPLYPKNERVRGYNQAHLLAAQLASDIGRPIIPLLIRTKYTPSQVELTRSERAENVRSAFALHPYMKSHPERLHDRSFLLVDDVCTSASTLAECARVLRQARVRSVKALVLARDL